jgi:alternate signal-mediated exported protein
MKNRKTIIALLLVAIVGIVGLTIAYFANSQTIENNFITKEYGTEVVEEFVSPENWLPGDTTTKTVVAQNTGQVDQAVRVRLTEEWKTYKNGTLNGWIHPDGTKSTHTTETELSTDERVAVINFANNSDWTKVGDYYYYNYKLAPNESTSSLIKSVTFNSKTKLDYKC